MQQQWGQQVGGAPQNPYAPQAQTPSITAPTGTLSTPIFWTVLFSFLTIVGGAAAIVFVLRNVEVSDRPFVPMVIASLAFSMALRVGRWRIIAEPRGMRRAIGALRPWTELQSVVRDDYTIKYRSRTGTYLGQRLVKRVRIAFRGETFVLEEKLALAFEAYAQRAGAAAQPMAGFLGSIAEQVEGGRAPLLGGRLPSLVFASLGALVGLFAMYLVVLIWVLMPTPPPVVTRPVLPPPPAVVGTPSPGVATIRPDQVCAVLRSWDEDCSPRMITRGDAVIGLFDVGHGPDEVTVTLIDFAAAGPYRVTDTFAVVLTSVPRRADVDAILDELVSAPITDVDGLRSAMGRARYPVEPEPEIYQVMYDFTRHHARGTHRHDTLEVDLFLWGSTARGESVGAVTRGGDRLLFVATPPTSPRNTARVEHVLQLLR